MDMCGVFDYIVGGIVRFVCFFVCPVFCLPFIVNYRGCDMYLEGSELVDGYRVAYIKFENDVRYCVLDATSRYRGMAYRKLYLKRIFHWCF